MLGRARALAHRARASAGDLRSPRRTVGRDVFAQLPPAPSAFAHFGDGSWIVPPCDVRGAEAISVGDAVVVLEHSSLRVIGTDLSCDPKLVLGDGVRLTRFVSIVCEVGISLGDGVASSDGVAIFDTWRDEACPADGPGGLPLPGPGRVRIDRGAYLGYGCTVLPGVHIGEGAFVGEGAVVVDDVPAHTVVYGNPARVIRRHRAETETWEGQRWP